MPIVLAPTGVMLKIVRIAAGEEIGKRLREMGLTESGEVKVLSSSGGSVIVEVKDGKVALDAELSKKVFVKIAD